MACELKPLTRREYNKRYRFAWNNGWVFGTAFPELYLDYLEGWEYFKKYLDKLVKYVVSDKQMSIKILIGEAPPMWKGTNKANERTYFYNPNHNKGNQPWLYETFKYFNKIDNIKDWDANDKYVGPFTEKQDKLSYLAGKGVILIDIFPFPIIQDTNNRKKIDTKSFSTHVNEYLIDQLNKLFVYLECEIKRILVFECAFIAPEYTSLQLMYDPGITQSFTKLNLTPLKGFTVFKISEITFEKCKGKIPLKNKPSESKEMSYFLYKLNNRNSIIASNKLENIPILISNRKPNFKIFFNSNKKLLKKKFS
ncbi:MAG: hypothetical protein ACKO7D_03350 [Bacteroidota bacterium]